MRIYNRISEYEIRKELRNNMTRAERLLWSKLKAKQLKGLKFRRQHSIGSYIVDFYCPKLRLVIELDGKSHLGEENQEYDRARQDEIESLGISFLRFTNQDVYKNLDKVLKGIEKYYIKYCKDHPALRAPLLNWVDHPASGTPPQLRRGCYADRWNGVVISLPPPKMLKCLRKLILNL